MIIYVEEFISPLYYITNKSLKSDSVKFESKGIAFFLEKDPYPVDALPTCNHALSVCQQEHKCKKLFEDFKLNCKVRDNKCRMEDR